MPVYWKLKRRPIPDRHRTIDSLLRLRSQIAREVPRRTARDTLLLATWNLRDFDSNKFGHGPRLPEAFHYIAEVISAFDIVALQEINRSLRGLHRVMDLLGPKWDYLVTDVTEGPSGNGERMAYVYDTRKVHFTSVAGEIVLPSSQRVEADRQFARTPFLASFQSGWLKFKLCNVHMYYGSASGEKFERRVEEIDRLGAFLKKRFDRNDENFVVLGDMNIVSPDDPTMKALTKHKFTAPHEAPTNMAGTKHYDQIAFLKRKGEMELSPSTNADGDPMNCGVLNPYHSVFRAADWPIYHGLGKSNGKWPASADKRRTYFRNSWRTFQLSDHLPLWVELQVDFTKRYLHGIRDPEG